MTPVNQDPEAGEATTPAPAPPSRRAAAIATLLGTGGATAVTVVQAFLLIPLALAGLGTPLYGSWLAASELLVFIQAFDMGIPNLITQRIGAALGRHDRVTASLWASSGLALVLVAAVCLGAAAAAAAPAIASWAAVAPDHRATFVSAFRIGAAASVLLMLYNGFLAIARGVQMTGIINAGQVVGALGGLTVSIVLLYRGYGLWALALGLVTRAAVSLVSGGWFLYRTLGRGVLVPVVPSRAVGREMAGLSPPLAGATAGYLLANHSEIVLVTTLFGPSAAAVYGLTKRAADGVRGLIDAIAWAAYGAFANLVTADDRHRARAVADEVLYIRRAIAGVCGAVLIAINEPFVVLLFGREHFGGFLLTIAFALLMIVGGQAFLANYLYRAAGGVRAGSYLFMAEALLRILAMALAFSLGNLAAGPFAAVLVSAAGWLVARHKLQALTPFADLRRPLGPAQVAAPWLVVAFGAAVGAVGVPESWAAVAAAGALVGGAATLVIVLVLPQDFQTRSLLRWKRA